MEFAQINLVPRAFGLEDEVVPKYDCFSEFKVPEWKLGAVNCP